MADKLIPTRRGVVLRALSANYPHPLAQVSLDLQIRAVYLGPDGAAAARRDLAYLVERGLIRREEDQVGGAKLITWYLTADGLNVVEGVAKDPGVEIVQEG